MNIDRSFMLIKETIYTELHQETLEDHLILLERLRDYIARAIEYTKADIDAPY